MYFSSNKGMIWIRSANETHFGMMMLSSETLLNSLFFSFYLCATSGCCLKPGLMEILLDLLLDFLLFSFLFVRRDWVGFILVWIYRQPACRAHSCTPPADLSGGVSTISSTTTSCIIIATITSTTYPHQHHQNQHHFYHSHQPHALTVSKCSPFKRDKMQE